MSSPGIPDEWSNLLNSMADETLTAEQEHRLVELLRMDDKFRLEYVRFCQLLTHLNWQLFVDSTPTMALKSTEVQSRWQLRNPAWILAATFLIGMLAWLGLSNSRDVAIAHVVSQISGEVEIIRGESSPTWLSPEEIERSPVQLKPGDQLVTGRRSSATLTLSDQTVIRMRPQTEVALSGDGRSRIILPSGSIRATVAPQSPGHPLMFATSNSEVLVLGTELELLTSGERSAVAVMEGSVQVTRTSDNATTTLSSGKFVSIPQSGEFSVVSWPQPPSKWSLDFEHGLPSGWRGRKVAVGLPEDSQGGIAPVPVLEDGEVLLHLHSPIAPDGLFSWHNDSVLHVTFKVQPPGWFHISLVTRTYDHSRPSMRFVYANPDLWETLPGEWRTVSIPLSEFRKQHVPSDESKMGQIPIQIIFSGESRSGEFVVDHIRVDRLLALNAGDNVPEKLNSKERK